MRASPGGRARSEVLAAPARTGSLALAAALAPVLFQALLQTLDHLEETLALGGVHLPVATAEALLHLTSSGAQLSAAHSGVRAPTLRIEPTPGASLATLSVRTTPTALHGLTHASHHLFAVSTGGAGTSPGPATEPILVRTAILLHAPIGLAVGLAAGLAIRLAAGLVAGPVVGTPTILAITPSRVALTFAGHLAIDATILPAGAFLTLTQAASHLLARLLALRFVELAIAVLVEPLEHLGAVGSLLGLGGAAQKGSKGKGECESLTLHVGSVRALKGVLFPRSTLEFRN